MYKSRESHEKGAMIRVDRKCRGYAWMLGRWCGVAEAGSEKMGEECDSRDLL